jgi:hypothetical protein
MRNAWFATLFGVVVVIGGSIAHAEAPAQAAKPAAATASAVKANPTFVNDIAPILAKHCMTCHRPGEVAPMSLLTYEETRPWAKSVREAVVSGAMPPWHADPRYGVFENENRLTETEIALITQWVNSGSQRGEGTFTPPKFADGWQIPPDLVFEMPEEYVVPADGPDINIELEVPMNLTEDIWVISAETRGNPRVVHHNVVSVIGPDGKRDSTGRLASYTPGKLYDKYGEDAGKFIRKGSKLLFSMHYHPNGEVIKDRSKIGLKLARKPLKYQVHTKVIADPALAIPPNDPNYRSVGEWVFDVDAEITLFKPHMHWRGKDMLFKAIYPDGKEEILLSVPKFDMNWQMTYEYATPKAMAKGTKLVVIAHFDNSANNPWNPDPSVKVLWGMDSRDEMMEGWFDYRVKLPGTVTSVQDGK